GPRSLGRFPSASPLQECLYHFPTPVSTPFQKFKTVSEPFIRTPPRRAKRTSRAPARPRAPATGAYLARVEPAEPLKRLWHPLLCSGEVTRAGSARPRKDACR